VIGSWIDEQLRLDPEFTGKMIFVGCWIVALVAVVVMNLT
jgi:hypothetical protein